MFTKTVKEFLKETELSAVIFYERYIHAFEDRSCNEATQKAYCQFAKNNYELRDVLQHIESYGKVRSAKKCAACKHNEKHVTDLQATYKKYKKWVDSAIKNSIMKGSNA
jgi:hypothetical protein